MGDKLTPITKFEDYTLPDEGVNVFIVSNASIVKERKGQDGAERPGWEYKTTVTQEGGGADGSNHFESFYTESKGNFSLSRMFGFLVKLGIYKPDAEVDSDMFKTETFAKKWPLIIGKKLGINIEHKANNKGKVQSKSKEFLTANEAKEAGKGKSTAKIEAEPAKAAAVDDGWGD